MATRDEEKLILENKIYYLLKEMFFEEPKEGNSSSDSSSSNEKRGRRDSVMKWLNSAQELHSVLAYELFLGKNKTNATDSEKATARSLFSKKFRGHDADNKPYSFNDDEINNLYGMKERFINRIE